MFLGLNLQLNLSKQQGVLAGWLSTYGKPSTKRLYGAALKHFLSHLYGGKLSKTDVEFESLASTFISECKGGRNWFKDLVDFAVYLSNRPPKTAFSYMNAVKGFIEFCLDVELSKKQAKILRSRLPKGVRARTVDGELTRERLRSILTHCDVKGKALFLFLASSGIRVGEALQLQLGDVDLNSDPVKVVVRGEYAKEGDKYYTFISTEAKDALLEWLKVRDSYLHSSSSRGRGLKVVKSVDDERLFPFSTYVANAMWTNAVNKAGLEGRDASTKRRKFHIHLLRKFFQTQLKYANVPEDIVEALIGHRGYLDDAYRRYSFEQMVEAYKKGEPYLYINVPTEIREIQTKFSKEQEEQRNRIMDLTLKLTDANALMIKLMAENEQIRKEQEALKQKLTSLEMLYDKLFELRPEELRMLLQEISRLLSERQKIADIAHARVE